MDTTGSHINVHSVPVQDERYDGYKIHKIEPTNNVQSGLNDTQALVFKYAGDNTTAIKLVPGRCAFRVRAAFRTKAAQINIPENETADQRTARVAAQLAADKAAKITLSPNWFWHLMSNYKNKVANEEVENLSEPGVYADTMALFKGSEYKRTYGELSSYIPDEGSGEANDLAFVVTNPAVAADAALPANVVGISNNRNYNRGMKRRLERYNYYLPDADTTGLRYIEDVFPASDISGFFATDQTLLNTPFEITLTRKAKDNFKEAVFGAAGTNIEFGNTTDTGITSITLELYEQKPSLAAASQLNADFENSDKLPIPFSFMKATCRGYQMESAKMFPISETSFTVPRYVIMVFKGKTSTRPGDPADTAARQDDSVTKNFSLNAHANIKSIQVIINGDEYPNAKQKTEFNKNYFSEFYQQYINTCTSLAQDPCLTSVEFKNLYPVFAFDCSYQKKKVSTMNTNLRVEIERNDVPDANVSRMDPRNLQCYMIVLEDRFLQLNAKQGNIKAFSVVS